MVTPEAMGALQAKNVPHELHEQLRRRAAAAGLTLADYVLDVLRREVALPTWDEWFAEVEQFDPGPSTRRAPAEAVRVARRARNRQLRDATRS